MLILITFLYEISNEGKRERNVKTVCITEEHLEMYKDSTKKGYNILTLAGKDSPKGEKYNPEDGLKYNPKLLETLIKNF